MRCHAISTADTFEEAKQKLNHAIGLGRGIKCGDNYNKVVEIGIKIENGTKIETIVMPTKKEIPKTETKTETPKKTQIPKTETSMKTPEEPKKSKKEKYL